MRKKTIAIAGLAATAALAGTVVAAVAVVAAADDSSDDPSAAPVAITGDALYAYPFDTLEDWVSYADAVVIVTVTGEERIAPERRRRDAVARGEGVLIGRELTADVDRVLWRHASVPELPSSLVFETAGWVLHDSGEVPFSYEDHHRMEVGRQYVVPLRPTGDADRAGALGAIGRGVIPVEDGRLAASDDRVDDHAVVRLAGLTPDAAAAALAETRPDPVAEANRNVDVERRYQAVLDAEG